jgi:hypothetical protein
VPTLEDLEARVAALGVETQLTDFRQETNVRFSSVDEQLAEIKDLILGRNGG